MLVVPTVRRVAILGPSVSDALFDRTDPVGQSIRIRKAAMGSFFANINDAAAIRMRREN